MQLSRNLPHAKPVRIIVRGHQSQPGALVAFLQRMSHGERLQGDDNPQDDFVPSRDAIEKCFGVLQDQSRAINQNPPRDLDAAIQTVLTRHAEVLKERAAQVHPPALGLEVVERKDATYGLSPLGHAYEALGSGFAQEHLTGKQKQRLVPSLIDLLTDHQVVANFTPVDGPVIASHKRAYALLRTLTRKEFPAPLVDLPADPAAAAAETSRRQAEWQQWWASNPKLGD